MFPYVEERMKWDKYGEVIWPKDHTIGETATTEENIKTEKLVAESDQLQDVSEVPTKCIAVTVTLDINAGIQYIDFEGRTDGESMRKILSRIKPRQLVLIQDTEEAKDSLADYCRFTAGLVQGSMFTPSIGETIGATTESHIYQNEAGRMQLEGAISKDYFNVRDLLYKQYAIV